MTLGMTGITPASHLWKQGYFVDMFNCIPLIYRWQSRGAQQISKRYENFNTRSRAFESLRNLTIWYLMRYWIDHKMYWIAPSEEWWIKSNNTWAAASIGLFHELSYQGQGQKNTWHRLSNKTGEVSLIGHFPILSGTSENNFILPVTE